MSDMVKVGAAEAGEAPEAINLEKYDINRYFPAEARTTYLELARSALRMFSKYGFERTKTRDISAGADLSAGAMYVHFRSKEEMLYAISLAAHKAVESLIDDGLEIDLGPLDRMEWFLYRFIAWHAENAMAARVIYRDWPLLDTHHRTEIVQLRTRIESKVRSLLTTGLEAGVFAVDDPELALYAILSLAIDVSRWYGEVSRYPIPRISHAYTQLALRMLQPR